MRYHEDDTMQSFSCVAKSVEGFQHWFVAELPDKETYLTI